MFAPNKTAIWPEGTDTPLGWAAAATAVAGIAGSAIQAGAAGQAASEQAGAAENAQQIAENEFNTITSQESPYMQAGYGAQSQLNYLLGVGTPGAAGGGSGTTPGTATSSTAGGYGSLLQPFTAQYMQQYSPAYQFQLQQGQQGVLNSDATGQGALSGAALKDLTAYNQNYANTAYNNAFNQYQTQLGNTYSRLSGVAQLGQNAAANTGQQGTALAGSAAQSATNIGTAQAGGTVGAANALAGGLSSASLPWLYANQNTGVVNPGLPSGGNIDLSNSGIIGGYANYPSSGAPSYSDFHLKTALEPYRFFETPGLMAYSFEFKDDPGKKHVGYVAQEVRKKYPDAISYGPRGYLMVDYDELPGWKELDQLSREFHGEYQ